jgi:hypothetical protein
MKEWKPMVEVEEIKQNILDSSNEIQQIEKKSNQLDKNGKPPTSQEPRNNEGEEHEGEEDHMIENQDENPLTILEVTV